MASSPDSSLFNDTQNKFKEDMDAIVDHTIIGLKKCVHEYKQKAKENNIILEKLGCNINNLSPDIKNKLKEIFGDNEVFNFNCIGSKELIMVNPQHMLDSFQACNELAEAHRVKVQLNSAVARLINFHNHLQQKLQSDTKRAQELDEKTKEMAVQELVFKGKLEDAQQELMALQKAAQTLERSKYSVKEMAELEEESMKLNEELAFTKTKLNKYNNLPVNEKEAARQLTKLKQELARVSKEIGDIVNATSE